MLNIKPVAILAGCLALLTLGGCHVSSGKPVIWLRNEADINRARNAQQSQPIDADSYQPVGEYSIDGVGNSADQASATQTGQPVKSAAHGLFHRRNRQEHQAIADVDADVRRNAVSEPVEIQHRFVPQPERQPAFWERVGNGFRSMTDFARGQRPVNALAVLPFHPNATKQSAEQPEREPVRSIHIPAFTFQAPESISQTMALDATTELPGSDLVTHWSEYPATSGGADIDEAKSADGSGALRQAPQTTATP